MSVLGTSINEAINFMIKPSSYVGRLTFQNNSVELTSMMVL